MEILGWVANLLFGCGGIVKKPKYTMIFDIIAELLYVISYISLGLFIAAFAMGINILRAFLALFLNKKQNAISTLFLTSLAIIIIASNLSDNSDLLVMLAAICIGISIYCRDNYIAFKLLVCLSQILWMAHSILHGVYPMMFCCALVFTTNLFALIYYTEIFLKIKSNFKLFRYKIT